MTKRLNLGCGTDIRKGWVNLDKTAIKGVDIICDIERQPLPFNDNEFDEILCQDVLEHTDYIPLVGELHRILKKGGSVFIRAPHFSSLNRYLDPTHKNSFSYRTFDFFITGHTRSYYFNFSFSRTVNKRITFRKNIFYCYNYIVEPVINIHDVTRKLYEGTFISRFFPAEDVQLTLIK